MNGAVVLAAKPGTTASLIVVLLILNVRPGAAQDQAPNPDSFALTGMALDQAATTDPTPGPAPPTQSADQIGNPWDDRPECASMFLKTDWQLSHKQRACTWLHDGVFSTKALLGAVWSARFSQDVDLTSERGDGFGTRFGRKFGQNAIKSTAIYLGALVADEDTRSTPPFLVMRPTPPRGFWRRLGGAIAGNVVSHRCVKECTSKDDIRKRPVLSKLAGSIASGFAGELFTTDRPNLLNHAARGAASAYAATFSSAVLNEFKPELSAFGGRIFRFFGGSR